MAFGILRLQKIKSMYSLRATLRHAFREQDTPNSDPDRVHKNQIVGARSVAQAIAVYHDKIKSIRVRKNAVLAIEHLITASPEFFETATQEQTNEFFNKSLNWLKNIYGKENVFVAGLHLDEKTPHLFAYVVPIHEKKLNARFFIGGHKKRLSELQTDFHKKCCEGLGLKRGVEKSRAKHTEVRHWYTVMREVLNLPAKTTATRIKMIFGDELDDLAKGAAAHAAAARQSLEKTQRAVLALKKQQCRADTAEERLKHAEQVIEAMEREKISQNNYIDELEKFKILVERNKDILAKSEMLKQEKPVANQEHDDEFKPPSFVP